MKTKASLLCIALTGIFSTSAFAELDLLPTETVLPAESVQVKNASEESVKLPELEQPKQNDGKSDAATVINPEKSLKYSMDYAEKQNDLNLLQIDLKALQVKSQIELIEKEKRKELEQNALAVEKQKWEKEKSELILSHKKEIEEKEKTIAQISAKKASAKKAEEKLSVDDRIYVTRISGIGQNMSARVYIDNNIRTAKVGDVLLDGVSVTKLSLDGMILDVKGKRKVIPITTADKAYFKTLEKQSSSENSAAAMPMDMSGLPPGLRF